MYCHIQCSKQRNDPNKSENENLGERKHYAVQIERHWFAVSHCIATEWQQETWSSITFLNKNAKCTLVQALRLCTGRTAHRGSRGTVLLFLDHGTRRGWGVSVTPRPLFTPGKTRYPLNRRLDGAQGRSGKVRKISPPPWFDPRTVQPIVSHYTDWATGPQHFTIQSFLSYEAYYYAETPLLRVKELTRWVNVNCKIITHMELLQ